MSSVEHLMYMVEVLRKILPTVRLVWVVTSDMAAEYMSVGVIRSI